MYVAILILSNLRDLFINVDIYLYFHIPPLKGSFCNQEERKIQNFMKSRYFVVRS